MTRRTLMAVALVALLAAGCATAGQLPSAPAAVLEIENATAEAVTLYAAQHGRHPIFLGIMGAKLTRAYVVPGLADFWLEARRGHVVVWRALVMPRGDPMIRIRYHGRDPRTAIVYRDGA